MNIKVLVVGVNGGMGQHIRRMVENTPDFEFVAGVGLGDGKVLSEKFWPANLLAKCIKETQPDVIVDFTTAEAVVQNLPVYIESQTRFVIGTTAWDQSLLADCPVHGVVAPNMSPRLVALQAGLEYMAESFPGIFDGFTGLVNESHQEWKEKPSGTGELWRKIFERLGAFMAPMFTHRHKKEIHAFHSYELSKGALGKESTQIRLVTDIDGRMEYMDGIEAAIRFLYMNRNHRVRIFSMIDVLSCWKAVAKP